ncbi:unnamed protein product [Lactuca virosa]|uniref:ENT domain-containing protein n=1 Tax=Lactuca virosa TaxID=75947 RepID=A0AAU9NAB8_9ASTR|nr:unnamed protein product [Lactuca virosa]
MGLIRVLRFSILLIFLLHSFLPLLSSTQVEIWDNIFHLLEPVTARSPSSLLFFFISSFMDSGSPTPKTRPPPQSARPNLTSPPDFGSGSPSNLSNFHYPCTLLVGHHQCRLPIEQPRPPPGLLLQKHICFASVYTSYEILIGFDMPLESFTVMQHEMESQIHYLEQIAYSSVLHPFKSQSDALHGRSKD